VLLGDGKGGFGAATHYSLGRLSSVALADFDGDGRLDVAATSFSDSLIVVMRGNGDGTFRTPGDRYMVGWYPNAMVVADLDGDGRLDLASANQHSNSVSILSGNGDGTFRPAVDYGTGGYPIGLTFGDFNRDGRIDLAATAWGVDVLINSGCN
jgi:hypothetical protein